MNPVRMLREALEGADGDFYLAMIGEIEPQQGQAAVREALQAAPEAEERWQAMEAVVDAARDYGIRNAFTAWMLGGKELKAALDALDARAQKASTKNAAGQRP